MRILDTRQFTVYQDVDGTFQFKGKLTIHDLEYLKEFLDASLSRSKRITLSMEEVEYADTATLQLLIAFKRSRDPEVEWKVIKLSPGLEKILEVSNLKKALV